RLSRNWIEQRAGFRIIIAADRDAGVIFRVPGHLAVHHRFEQIDLAFVAEAQGLTAGPGNCEVRAFNAESRGYDPLESKDHDGPGQPQENDVANVCFGHFTFARSASMVLSNSLDTKFG